MVGNNTAIEDHCFQGVKSTVAGGCHIGGQSIVRMNCVAFDDMVIGNKCILGHVLLLKSLWANRKSIDVHM